MERTVTGIGSLHLVISSSLHHLQESHHEGIGEDEFLLATPELHVDELLALVELNHLSFAEFLVHYRTADLQCVQALLQFLFRL